MAEFNLASIQNHMNTHLTSNNNVLINTATRLSKSGALKASKKNINNINNNNGVNSASRLYTPTLSSTTLSASSSNSSSLLSSQNETISKNPNRNKKVKDLILGKIKG